MMKIRPLARLSVCSNHTGFSLPDSITIVTRMDAEDGFVWTMVAIGGKLPCGNHGESRANRYSEYPCYADSACIPLWRSVNSLTFALEIGGGTVSARSLPPE